MKREIKFRAKKDDMSDHSFKYGCLLYSSDLTPRIQYELSNLYHTCIKGTEGQFTGLYDKNGVEIYEGDIIKTETGKNMICYYNKIYSYFGIKDNQEFYDYNFKQIDAEFIEVIGNIHEHKHLIQ